MLGLSTEDAAYLGRSTPGNVERARVRAEVYREIAREAEGLAESGGSLADLASRLRALARDGTE